MLTGIPYGLVARISGFHPEGLGSIPGMGGSILNSLIDGTFAEFPYVVMSLKSGSDHLHLQCPILSSG